MNFPNVSNTLVSAACKVSKVTVNPVNTLHNTTVRAIGLDKNSSNREIIDT